MFEAEQFRPQPDTSSLPTVWASAISVGLHAIIWFVQPILPFNKSATSDSQRTVRIVELTPAEISRLPEFAPPPLPPPLPPIPPPNLLPPLPPIPSTMPVIPIPGKPSLPPLSNNSTQDNTRKQDDNREQVNRSDRNNNNRNQSQEDKPDRNNNRNQNNEDKKPERNNNNRNQNNEDKKPERNNNNRNQSEDEKPDRNNNRNQNRDEDARDRNNNNRNQSEDKKPERNNNNRNQSEDKKPERNNNNRNQNRDEDTRDRNNNNRNQRDNLSADERLQRIYGYNPNGTDKADGAGKLSIWIDQNSDKFPIKDIKQEKEPRIVRSPLEVYLPNVTHAIVAVLVDPEGKIIGEPELSVKTGYPDHLDPAIIEDAKKRTFEPTGSHIVYVYTAKIDQSKLTPLTGRTSNN